VAAVIERQLLKVHEFADIANISRALAYKLVASGEVQAIRVGSDLRVPVGVMQAWIDKKLADSGAQG
jgi:hypothetical protein